MFREPAPRLNVQAPSEPFSANIYTHHKYHLLSQTLHLLSFAELFSTKTTTPSLSASSSRLETHTILFSHFRISQRPILRSSRSSSSIFPGSIFPTPIYTLTMKLASILLFLLVCLATPIPANLKLKANTASLSNKPVDK